MFLSFKPGRWSIASLLTHGMNLQNFANTWYEPVHGMDRAKKTQEMEKKLQWLEVESLDLARPKAGAR